jgi:hypothetical protein
MILCGRYFIHLMDKKNSRCFVLCALLTGFLSLETLLVNYSCGLHHEAPLVKLQYKGEDFS